jgi:hypothetical protein
MYIPEPFKEDRIDVLHDAIRRAGLAILISLTSDGLIASHIPLLLDPEPAPYGTLRGHLARPNLQAPGAVSDALADFPWAGFLHHAILVSEQALDREGRTDLELCRYPRLRDSRIYRRFRRHSEPRYRAYPPI